MKLRFTPIALKRAAAPVLDGASVVTFVQTSNSHKTFLPFRAAGDRAAQQPGTEVE